MNAEESKKTKQELEEKEHQLAFQKLVLEVAFDFMLIRKEDFNQKINSLLARLGEFTQADRTYLFKVIDCKQVVYSHEWVSKDSRTQIESIADAERLVDLTEYKWWCDQLKNHPAPYYIKDANELPAAAQKEQALLKKYNIRSTISVPIIVEGELCGFIGIDSMKTVKKWSPADIELLDALAEIIASGMRQIRAEEKTEYMAYYDQLTGLPNARLFEKRVHKAIKQAKQEGNILHVLFIDLDEFKKINDSLGHEEGDKLLKELGKRLVKIVGENNTVTRRGGDEFILLVKDCQEEEQLIQMLRAIVEALKKPFHLNHQQKYVTGSIGISQYPDDGEDAKALIKYADIAMYHAKSLGKNQFQKMTPELKVSTEKDIILTNDLYQAIENNEFEVFYQPIVKSKNAEIVGLEALLRWKHPVYGYVSPGDFIPLAERMGLINEIGYWVTKTVYQQLSQWNQKRYKKLYTAVNFSVHELNQPNLKEQLKGLINQYSLNPYYLEIEITENVGLDYLSPTVSKLNEIEALGLTLTIDDYGQKYSSLSRLKDLNISKIKIDQLFIQGIGKNVKDETVIKAMISFAEILDLIIVAEGIETKEQADFFSSYEDIQLQGYYFYRPMPVEEVEKLLTFED